MTTFVALLRAVNVGGQNRIPMAELRQRLSAIGLADVRTYVQSGNVLFRAESDDPREQAAVVHDVIERDFDCDVRVLALTHEDLARVSAGEPVPGRRSGRETPPRHVPVRAGGGIRVRGAQAAGAGGRGGGADGRRAGRGPGHLPAPAAWVRPQQAQQLLVRARPEDAGYYAQLADGAHAHRAQRGVNEPNPGCRRSDRLIPSTRRPTTARWPRRRRSWRNPPLAPSRRAAACASSDSRRTRRGSP